MEHDAAVGDLFLANISVLVEDRGPQRIRKHGSLELVVVVRVESDVEGIG